MRWGLYNGFFLRPITRNVAFLVGDGKPFLISLWDLRCGRMHQGCRILVSKQPGPGDRSKRTISLIVSTCNSMVTEREGVGQRKRWDVNNLDFPRSRYH